MLLEIYCKQGGLCNGKGGSMHIADLRKGMLGANAIVGAAPPIAVGAALTHKTLGYGGVAMAFIGDGASNQGTVFESLNFSAVLKLPMIFMYENNGYSEFTGTRYHLAAPTLPRVRRHSACPPSKVDGMDFFAVYDAVARAVGGRAAARARAQSRHSPCAGMGTSKATCRNIANRRRSSGCASQSDPLVRFEERVTREFDIAADELREIDAEIAELIEDKVAVAKAAPKPTSAALYADVYGSY